MQHAAWRYHAGPFLDAVQRTPHLTRVAVVMGAGALVAFVLPLVGRLTRAGLGELEATIWFNDGRPPPLRTAARAVLSIVIVGLGASLGRESAPKQAGALLGGLLAQGCGIDGAERRLLAACGAGAGIAAVYNVPFGGAVFALEVMLGALSLPLVVPILLATVAGTATGWLLLPNEPTYRVPAIELTAGLAVFALLAGPIAGLASALFVKLIAVASAAKPKG